MVMRIPAWDALVGAELVTPDRDQRGHFSIGVHGAEVIEIALATIGLARILPSGGTEGCLHLA